MAGRSRDTLRQLAKEPEVQEMIRTHREAMKLVIAEKTPQLAETALNKAQASVDAADPKAFDSWMRGIHATEKTAASASGESRQWEGKMNHGGKIDIDADVTVELKALIGTLIQAVRMPEPLGGSLNESSSR